MTTIKHHTPPADARCAASVLLLRDRITPTTKNASADAQLEVLMLRRAERGAADQRSGAAVFPGGVLDAQDDLAYGFCPDMDDGSTSAKLGLASGGLSYLVAAVRETFEEVGLLLAKARQPSGELAPVTAAQVQQLYPWREPLNSGQAGIATLCAEHSLVLGADSLVYCSHWLTPPGVPKRFDTRFFMALAPVGQEAQADMGEAVELMWLTPQEALAPERGLKLLPVTRSILQDLSAYPTAASALLAAKAQSHVPLVMPRRAVGSRGPQVVLPHELPYAEVARLDPEGRGDVACDIVPGRAVRLSARVLRVTAPNPGAMTGPGTNTYLVGSPLDTTVSSAANAKNGTQTNGWIVIDPGPESAPHLQALLAAVAAQQGHVSHILVTHTHNDHSPGAVALAQATGAPVLGRVALHPQWQDKSFAPQRELANDETLCLPGTTLRVVHTPGHASNHLCYLLEEEATLFTGDHVMQGSTVVINPPDGDMQAYLKSLNDLLLQPLQWLAPGHGFLVADPHGVLRALIAHRGKREAKVLQALAQLPAGPIEALLPVVYSDVPSHLHGMAHRSLLAHLIKLQLDGHCTLQGSSWGLALER
jgi:glyoxylase-like metal-dependent hydrolase (beta-lactamase superfamily II)/8-oxo-dGTP pyrophosphatase MutT (NUDIX family)